MKTPITIGETTAQCGEKVRGKLLAGEFSTGTEVYLPFIIINGAEDGNTVWVNACVQQVSNIGVTKLMWGYIKVNGIH